MLFGRQWLPKLTLTPRKEPLLQQGKRSRRTLDDPFSPLSTLIQNKTKQIFICEYKQM